MPKKEVHKHMFAQTGVEKVRDREGKVIAVYKVYKCGCGATQKLKV